MMMTHTSNAALLYREYDLVNQTSHMQVLTMGKSKVITSSEKFFDEDGFIKQPQIWNEQIARLLAKMDGLNELTDQHWIVIHTLRKHFNHFGTPPMFHHVGIVNHMDKHCVEQLFNSQRKAWRVAGLPNPGEEAKTYM